MAKPPGEEDEILKFLVESCHRWKDAIIETSPYHLRRLEASISHRFKYIFTMSTTTIIARIYA